MKRIFSALFMIFMFVSQAFSDPLEYDLSRMKQMNPDFITYPDENGIIWLKHTEFSRSEYGGMEIKRLYVILGRRGLDSKWLNQNIQIPDKGRIEIVEADIYDFESLVKISSVTPDENENGFITLNFSALSENFILVLAWNEILPEQLTFEGSFSFQEDLRLWECVTEIYAPQEISFKTFPEKISPEIEEYESEILYRWRKINTESYKTGQLIRTQKSGCIFSTRTGNSGLPTLIREAQNSNNVPLPKEAKGNVSKLIEYLKKQPEIIFTENFTKPRKIPSKAPYSKREKIILADSWLKSQKFNSNILWSIPFDVEDDSPLCSAMFFSPVLEVQSTKNFHDFGLNEILEGLKVFLLHDDGKLRPRKIPQSKSADNRLTANMNLKVDEKGMLSGNVKVILRGAWKVINPDISSLFPTLSNYKNVKYKDGEISFEIENMPGIAGNGVGILAVIPFFEPVQVRELGMNEDGFDVLFPFIIEQNIELGLPKKAKEALVSGKIDKNPDKINFSQSYKNKRHRLLAEARFELNMPHVSSGNISLLRRHLDQWRSFSAKNIPVR